MFVEFAVVHMSARGTKLLNARALVCPEELAKADMRPFRGGIQLLTRSGPRSRSQFALQQPLGQLLDHLVGAGEQRGRHLNAKPIGCLVVDN